jgi:hypothetical protein
MRNGSFDLATLVSGLAITAFGAVLLADRLDAFTLDFGVLAPLTLAVLGVILLVGGLLGRDRP